MREIGIADIRVYFTTNESYSIVSRPRVRHFVDEKNLRTRYSRALRGVIPRRGRYSVSINKIIQVKFLTSRSA